MRADENVLVSIVIPVKNGDYWLNDTLKTLLNQKIDGEFEIIIIDSGSTDNTLAIVKNFPVRLIQVDPKTFNHGATRNEAVEACNGQFIAMTVQDAQPVDDCWLKELLAGFDNENVAGVCGQQVVPHKPDTNPIEWFRPQSAPQMLKFSYPDSSEFEKLSPSEKRRVCGWDNVTAMYRKKTLKEVPFGKVAFAEDALWAKNVLLKGYSIVYNTAARVYHYHLEEPEYTVRRLFTVYYHFYKYFNYIPPYVDNGITRRLRDIKSLLSESRVPWRDKWKWYRYNQVLRKNINKAVEVFVKSQAQGEDSLEKEHTRFSSVVPQAIKPA